MPIDNKEVCRRTFDEIWNQKKIEVADELIAANYVHHDPQSPPCNNLDQYKQFVRYYLNAFPDLHFAIEDQIADGDTVVTRYTATGTHNGDVAGIPATGRRISVTGMVIGRVRNGKFVEGWGNWDTFGLMQQLGVVPAEAKGKAA